MKKISFLFFIIFFLLDIEAQEKQINKLELIQGVWENTLNSDSDHSYKIIKGMNSLGFSYNSPSELGFYLIESIEGFQNKKYSDFDSINVNSFDKNGTNFTTIINKKFIKSGWVKKKYCIVPEYFECDGQNMSINGGQLIEFAKIDRLPNLALKMLLDRGKLDKRNYLKEYLGVDVREVKVAKSIINSNPGMPTKMYLLKGDVLTILEEKGEWIKIEFEGKKLVQGWVKKNEVM
jgi:hypothetical protein